MRLRYKGSYRYRLPGKARLRSLFREIFAMAMNPVPAVKPEWICFEHWVASGYEAGKFIKRLLRIGIRHFEVHVNEPKRIFGLRHA